MKEGVYMRRYKVEKNTKEPELLTEIEAKLVSGGGYCPCRIDKVPDNLCICKEFRDQMADPEWEGECHCGRYVKTFID